MRAHIVAAALLTSLTVTSAFAQSEPASARVAQTKYSTGETNIGALLDDPATRAILDKHLPGFASDSQVDMARSMTLKGIQPYAPNITDAVLAAIDADLAKLSSKKK